MDPKLVQFCNDEEVSKSMSFENMVIFALNLTINRTSVEQLLSQEVSSNVVQESEHEIRVIEENKSLLEKSDLNKCLYRALTYTEVKKMLSSSSSIFSKVSNNCNTISCKTDITSYIDGGVMIVDKELDLDDSEADSADYIPMARKLNAEVESLIPKGGMHDDTTTLKHVIITDDLKFHCKLCNCQMDTYVDLFTHVNEVLHQTLVVKEERRLDFVYHKRLLLRLKHMRELLAEENEHVSILQADSYNCQLCDKCFSCEVDTFVHMSSLKHQLARVRKERLCVANRVRGLLGQKGMVEQGLLWQCSVCSVDKAPREMTLAEAVMHIKRQVHKDNLVEVQSCAGRTDAQHEKTTVFSSDQGIEHRTETSVEDAVSVNDHINPPSKTLTVSKSRYFVNELPMRKLKLMTKEENGLQQNKIFDEAYKYMFYMCKGIFFCKLCTTFVSAYGVDYHVYSKFHSQALEEKAIVLSRLWLIVRLQEQGNYGNIAVDCTEPFQFECRLCQLKHLQLEEVLAHVASKGHMTNLRSGAVQYRKLSDDALMCRLCCVVVESTQYIGHASSERHRVTFWKHFSTLQAKQKQHRLFCKLPEILNMHEEYFRPVSDKETRCMFCKCNVPLATDDIWAHINDSYHISHMSFYLQKMLGNSVIVDEGKAVEILNEKAEIALNVCENNTIDNSVVCYDFSQIEPSCDDNVKCDRESTHHFSIDCNKLYSKLSVIPHSIQVVLSSHKNFNIHCTELSTFPSNLLQAQNTRVVTMLEMTFRPVFPACNAVIFGSRLAGFAVDTNDIDVYLDIGSSKLQSHEHHISQRLFVRMGYRLLSSNKECKHLKEVPYARTPIIRFTYTPLGIDCDLNFMNEMSIQNTKLLRFYSMLDERVKVLILLVRHWAKSTGATRLGTAAKISNYALTLLAVYYLQQLDDPVVPTVEFLQSNHMGKKNFIRGWNCSFVEDPVAIPPSSNEMSVGELLCGFFRFCGALDFGQVVLCPHCGQRMSRRAFLEWMGQQRAHGSQWERFRIKSPMCVQDPLDLSHNVTKGVTSKCVTSFQTTCLASADLASKLCDSSEV